MKRPKILTLILAGGKGSRMGVLTKVRAKPALPYAGVYRLVDFPLSNCVHSELHDVWVVEQFQPHALNDHIANGRPWDLDRTYGGLRLLPPFTGTDQSGFAQGNADALYRNIEQIRRFEPDLVLVLSADHIYKLDYRDVIDAHREHSADVTMVTTRMPIAEAGRFGVVEVSDGERVAGFEYKPEQPRSEEVTTEVFVYSGPRLLAALDDLAAEHGLADNKEASLKDFGHELLPRMVGAGRAYAYPLDGYWRDVGLVESYWQSHMDLLADEPPLSLDEPAWPILTYGFHRQPARIHRTAEIENSLIPSGCEIRGRVVNSVLAPGVVVEEGAEVRNALVFHDTIVGKGARVEYAIVDQEARIGRRAHIGGRDMAGEEGDQRKPQITVIGAGADLPADVQVVAGGTVAVGGREQAPEDESEE